MWAICPLPLWGGGIWGLRCHTKGLRYHRRIKYFKFTTESKVPFSPGSPTAQKAKMYFIGFPKSSLVGSGFRRATYLLSKLPDHLDVVRRSLLITDHNAIEHSKTCKCSSGPRDTLNIMPIINKIFLNLMHIGPCVIVIVEE